MKMDIARSFRVFIVLQCIVLICSCSSGGSNANYSVNLETQSVDLHLPYALGGFVPPVTIPLTYSGEGLVFAFANSSEQESSITGKFNLKGKNSADLVIGWSGGRFRPIGQHSYNLRVYAGKLDGSQYVYQDFTLNVIQDDGFEVTDRYLRFNGNKEPGSFKLYTEGLNWETTSNSDAVRFNPTSGVGQQTVEVIVDYTKLPEDPSNISLTVHSLEGEQSIVVPLVIDNSLNFSYSDLSLGGFWNADEPGTAQFEVVTASQNWELTSTIPGLTLSPASGTASTEITVSYDSSIMPAGSVSGEVILTANGQSATKHIEVFISPPRIINDYCSFIDHNWRFDKDNASFEYLIELGNEGSAPWRIDSLPEWLSVESYTGSTLDPIRFSPNLDVIAPGFYGENFDVIVDIPGEPFTITCSIGITVQSYPLTPSRTTFAASDFIQARTHEWNVPILGLDRIISKNSNVEVEVSSNQNWLVFDKQENGSIFFHIDPTYSDVGMQYARLDIASQSHPWLAASSINVGYFRSSSGRNLAEIELPINLKPVAADKLGPFIYLVDSNKQHSIEVLNIATGLFEQPIPFNIFIDQNSTIYISENGRTLFAQESNNLSAEAIDIIDHSFALSPKLLDFRPTQSSIALLGKNYFTDGHYVLGFNGQQKFSLPFQTGLGLARPDILAPDNTHIMAYDSQNCRIFAASLFYAETGSRGFSIESPQYYSDGQFFFGETNNNSNCNQVKNWVSKNSPQLITAADNNYSIMGLNSNGKIAAIVNFNPGSGQLIDFFQLYNGPMIGLVESTGSDPYLMRIFNQTRAENTDYPLAGYWQNAFISADQELFVGYTFGSSTAKVALSFMPIPTE